mmetsp:Transcript_83179/g.182769  ORF Transcript_83179/g.182769 Transcript_83179/m.182769 type:complete len:88 (+) Transcript_83179:100-363(+)
MVNDGGCSQAKKQTAANGRLGTMFNDTIPLVLVRGQSLVDCGARAHLLCQHDCVSGKTNKYVLECNRQGHTKSTLEECNNNNPHHEK